MSKAHIVVRHTPEVDPAWQYYGTDIGAIGGADTLKEAKELASEAVEELAGTATSIVFDIERQALTETDDHAAIYVRALQDSNTDRRIHRQDLAVEYVAFLQNYPERKDTFHGMVSATGDIIAVVVFPDDLVCDVLESCGVHDSIFLGMPEGDSFYWLGLSGAQAEDIPEHAESLAAAGVRSSTSVRELMVKSGSMDPAQTRTLVTA